MDKRITNEQREVIVRNAVAERDRLLEQPTSEVPAVVDPTDPGHDVEVLRNHVRVLERRVRDLHRERNEAPAAKAVRMLTDERAWALFNEIRDAQGGYGARLFGEFARAVLNESAHSGAAGVPQPEFDRDTDGELLIDWSPAKGRMLSVSLRADGRLSYAITWDGEQMHGTANAV